MEKFTKRDVFTALLNDLQANPIDHLPLEDGKKIPASAVIERLTKELEILSNKASTPKKPTATQEANKVLQNEIADFLAERVGERFTCTELSKVCPACVGLSTSKISAQMSALLADNRVSKTIEKRVSYFSAV
mgnify:CR=1 FL=1